MRIRSVFLVMGFLAALLAAPWTASAQPIQGIYVGAGGGLRIPSETKNTSLEPGFGGAFDLNQRLGYDARLSLGYALGNGWRFEAEGTFGGANISGIGDSKFPGGAKGTVRNVGVMANALFDLDVGSPYVYPYLGLGAGYQSTRLSGVTVGQSAASFTADGSSGGFAAQAIMGLSFPVPNMPGLSITADYRFMDILGGGKFDGTSSVGPAPGMIKMHNQFVQSAIFGVRFAFDTPMPASLVQQTTVVTSAKTQSFLVYFALGSANLDERAHSVIAAAAQDAAHGQNTRVAVAGNADTSGSAGPNQALSERRARVVAAALVSAGVPRDAIAITAYGDTKPAVPTGPGVEQVQNRRVEIVVQ